MGQAFFYHLTRSPLEQALPRLLERALAAGWRVELRGREAARMAALDSALWRHPEDGFVPHGRAGGPHDARQPVLLTLAGEAAANDPACVMALDGAEVSAAEVAALARVCVLFDGHDPQAVEQARAQWRDLTAAGVAAQYWSEASGRWEKKAQTDGSAQAQG